MPCQARNHDVCACQATVTAALQEGSGLDRNNLIPRQDSENIYKAGALEDLKRCSNYLHK